MSALLLVAAGAGNALAFHSGGVAACDGCHTVHNSSGGMAASTKGSANQYLLQGSDPSSTCLICHSGATPTDSYRVATNPPPPLGLPPVQLTPGGDFAWLQKNYSWVDPATGLAVSSSGDAHGHNIIANDFLYFQDARNALAPGGTYPSASLSCISCHDPHGGYRILDSSGAVAKGGKPIAGSGSYGALPTASEAVGSYRMLAGAGYAPASYPLAPFVNDPPSAVSPATYNRAESTSDTRVAYGRGMSEWCGNCHAGLTHSSYPGDTVANHPSGNSAKLPTDVVATYNAYIATGNLGGTVANAYTSMVPFEEGTSDATQLAIATTSTAGPSVDDNVTCLTCHRAHASAWDSATRWNCAKGVYLTVAGSWPGIDAPTLQGQSGPVSTGKTMAEYQQGMYGRPASQYATNQWSLCNKCHENDSYKQ
ncbi:cytochrome C [Geomonas edaphica]|uniref:cytochrome C n=1 Tax=Geomonas edaphica TaxID=2570226 RepID=UPI00319E6857